MKCQSLRVKNNIQSNLGKAVNNRPKRKLRMQLENATMMMSSDNGMDSSYLSKRKLIYIIHIDD